MPNLWISATNWRLDSRSIYGQLVDFQIKIFRCGRIPSDKVKVKLNSNNCATHSGVVFCLFFVWHEMCETYRTWRRHYLAWRFTFVQGKILVLDVLTYSLIIESTSPVDMENTWFFTRHHKKRSIQCSKKNNLGHFANLFGGFATSLQGATGWGDYFSLPQLPWKRHRFHVAAMVGMQMDEGLKFIVKYPTSRQTVVLQMMNRTWQKLGVLELNMMLS